MKTANERDSFCRQAILWRTDTHLSGKFSAISGEERVSWCRHALPFGHSCQNRLAPTFRNVLRVAVKRFGGLNVSLRTRNQHDLPGQRPLFVERILLLQLVSGGSLRQGQR